MATPNYGLSNYGGSIVAGSGLGSNYNTDLGALSNSDKYMMLTESKYEELITRIEKLEKQMNHILNKSIRVVE